ncbi:MAG: hypothetical protein ACRDYC_01910 [Acidimicrobiales bacterium]
MIIAAAVVVVVVVLVARIISLARRIGEQTLQVTLALAQTRANTDVLQALPDVGNALAEINASAATARAVLEGQG